MIIDGMAGGLHEIDISSPHRFLNLNIEFAVCEAFIDDGTQIAVQVASNLLRKGRIR